MSELDERQDRATYLDVVSGWADDLAHEIKNPLHAMVINLELVRRRAESGDAAAVVERTEILESELHRVHDLVDSLLRLVRPWPPAESVTVDGVFDVLLPVFTARARIRRIEYTHTPGDVSVALAPGTLARALVTLVARAIDVTPEGGRLATAVEVAADTARITMTHTGEGATELGGPGASDHVAAEDEAAGEGLEDRRLAAVRRTVEASGGSVVAALEGGERRITLILPRSGAA